MSVSSSAIIHPSPLVDGSRIRPAKGGGRWRDGIGGRSNGLVFVLSSAEARRAPRAGVFLLESCGDRLDTFGVVTLGAFVRVCQSAFQMRLTRLSAADPWRFETFERNPLHSAA